MTTTTTRPVLTLKRGKRPERAAAKPVALARKETIKVKAKSATPRPPQPQQEHTGNDVDLLAALQAAAPDLWNPRAPVPLAIGIHKQLYSIAEEVRMSRRSLRRFLSEWTSSSVYRRAMLEPEAKRYNLDGSEAEAVSEEHRVEARRRLGDDGSGDDGSAD